MVKTTTAFTRFNRNRGLFENQWNYYSCHGKYWSLLVALYIMLEEAGIEPYLVNAKHVKSSGEREMIRMLFGFKTSYMWIITEKFPAGQ
ncbi:MAG: hypothetical protein IPO62_07065 [Saprospiraceae bacterium]|nr:hypothetical protein [Saprospiraceae bacterium]